MRSLDKNAKAVILFILSAALLSGKPASAPAEIEFPRIHGFAEAIFAPSFTHGKSKHEHYNVAETRFQLDVEHYFTGEDLLSDWRSVLKAKTDLLTDLYRGGDFSAEVRELNLHFTPIDFMDVKIGRQILTWGTGDYVFLNDLFPKDYISFFIGRNDEYLKAPSDAARFMFYSDMVNVDFAVIPFFQPNEMPTGVRLSFFDVFKRRIVGVSSRQKRDEPAEQFENFTYALRAYRNFGSYEGALYYYRGFDPSPSSIKDASANELYYQRLDAYGASVRGPFLGGIGNAEVSYYYSPEDPHGDEREVRNSSMKYLLGYQKDLGNELSMGLQYYLEQMLDYAEYEDSLSPGDVQFDQLRHTLTHRVTKFFSNRTLELTVFTFFSPSALDLYTRPVLSWDATDAWTLTVGANLPWGVDDHTEFGSMRENKNVYARLRYSF